jgi:hypothetical protein
MIYEVLLYSNYEIREVRESQVDPGETHTVETGMRCPHCKVVLPIMKHGEKRTCHVCGLKMVVHGNALECWLEEKKT